MSQSLAGEAHSAAPAPAAAAAAPCLIFTASLIFHPPPLPRGIVYEAKGQYQDAADQYRAVIAVDSTDPAGW